MDEADVEVTDLFAYFSRIGTLRLDGEPVALAAIPATGRTMRAMTQEELLDAVAALALGPSARAADAVQMRFEDMPELAKRLVPLTWPTAVRLPDDHWTPYPVPRSRRPPPRARRFRDHRSHETGAYHRRDGCRVLFAARAGVTVATAITTVNPATGRQIDRYEEHTGEQVEQALATAQKAQARWRNASFAERSRVLHAAAALLRERRDEYARLITTEMGKPLGEAAAEVDKCARTCDFFAQEAEGLLADRVIETSARDSRVVYEPLGVVLAIMPWNFPFFQVVRFAAPALMAGNAGLLKHSPNTSGCALAVERLFADAGLPAGLFGALLVGDAAVAEVTSAIIDDPRVAAVTLTGSERAGTAVGAAAGHALKKSVLELGGSDPFVVLDDADVPAVAEMAARARFQNAGQSCIAAKRFVVAEAIADEFVERFAEVASQIVVGDPTDPATRMGPLARADLRDALDEQVRGAMAQGARAACGGRPLDGPGWFYAPTVLTDVTPGMPVFRQETFGPVAAIVRAADDDEAVELANDTQYGLGASVWTSDVERGLRLGRRVRSGGLFVNAIVASDPRVPFGGTKRSGYGRELAAEGIREFTNVRTVWVGASPAADGAPRAAE